MSLKLLLISSSSRAFLLALWHWTSERKDLFGGGSGRGRDLSTLALAIWIVGYKSKGQGQGQGQGRRHLIYTPLVGGGPQKTCHDGDKNYERRICHAVYLLDGFTGGHAGPRILAPNPLELDSKNGPAPRWFGQPAVAPRRGAPGVNRARPGLPHGSPARRPGVDPWGSLELVPEAPIQAVGRNIATAQSCLFSSQSLKCTTL